MFNFKPHLYQFSKPLPFRRNISIKQDDLDNQDILRYIEYSINFIDITRSNENDQESDRKSTDCDFKIHILIVWSYKKRTITRGLSK